ncbi:putative signaling protein [bacterium HR39]|nr:putative signaling protein [bacterium HR39]
MEAEDVRCHIGVSVGFALFPDHAATPEELLAAADLALYAAKRERGGVRAFDCSLRADAERRRRIEGELREHLAAGALEVHYQPLVELAGGRVSGVEALVRWPAGAEDRIPPDVFVAIAEECGLAPRITRLVLERAARDLPGIEAVVGRGLRLAVNLAPEELAEEGAARRLAGLIDELGLDPARLEFEITERTLLADAEVVGRNLRELAARGVRFAVDDFGTGYSSLVYLKRVPVSRLKLDRTFVAGLPEDGEDRAIVRAVASLAAALDLELLAEGVETEAQRRFLLGVGCREAQGWLFGRPMPAETLRSWLAAREAAMVP